MDEAIERDPLPLSKVLFIGAVGVVVVVLGWTILGGSNPTSLSIDSERVSVDQVRIGDFEEYIPVTGNVQPETTVYLDLQEGGIVEQIYIESGTKVRKGDIILGFSNTAVQKNNIDSETRLLENLNQLRNSKISLTEKNLLLKDQLLDLSFSIQELERTFERYELLNSQQNTNLSREKYESTRDQLAYLREKKALLEERIVQESRLRQQQSQQVDDSIERVDRSLAILSQIAESLELRAPIGGFLSSMNAEIGQNFQRGQRIGQIDQLDSFKVAATIDQYYIAKVSTGQEGTFEFGGQSFRLRIEKIYPEVNNDAFQVDLTFAGSGPAGIKRGQSLQIELSLSEAKTTNLVSKGGFYRYTNGRWVYRVSDDGSRAHRVDVVPGRQNPESFEVLEGLSVGDWIVSSSYEAFRDVDELVFEQPLQLTRSLKGS